RAEAVLQLRLRRLHVLALPLQRPGLGEMQVDGEDADVPGAHAAHHSSPTAGLRCTSKCVAVRYLAVIAAVVATLALGAAEAVACDLHSGSGAAPSVSAYEAMFPTTLSPSFDAPAS